MKIKNSDIVVINYNGVIKESTNELMQNSIKYQIGAIKEDKISDVLVSLKNAVYEDDINALKSLAKTLASLSLKLSIPISFIDYSMKLYPLLQKVTKKTKLKLFKNISAAKLFLTPKEFKEGMRVLIYDKDESNSIGLSKELSKYGYTVIRANDIEEFKKRMTDEDDHDVVITHSALNANGDIKKTYGSENALLLSKKLILNLPVFMDTAVETLVSFTGLESRKSKHGIKRFDTNLQMKTICAVMRFEGDLEGFFTLVFPRDIAVVALESLLGEIVSQDDIEVLKDGVGEFCNIITGAIKTVLSKKEIKMTFDLPKTYSSLEETDGFIGHNNGVWIDMQLAGKPFYMFITK